MNEDPNAVNACGGCSELPYTVGDPCGACNDGTYTCQDTNTVACTGATILELGEECPDPTCEGRTEGRLGDACDDNDGCCNANCGQFPPRNNMCTQTCSRYTSCNLSAGPMFCALGSPRECAPNDYGAPCTSGADCVDGLCLDAGPDGEACTWRCEFQADCPASMVCATYGTTKACSTMGETCNTDQDCRTGLCLKEGTGPGYCTAPCRNTPLVTSCPVGFTCEVVSGQPGVFVCQHP